MTIISVVFVDIPGIGVVKKMEIPFNFSKKIDIGRKDMSVNEDNNENEIEEGEETPTIKNNNKRVFQQSKYSYEYCEMVDNILRLRVDLFISKERLEIIHKLLDLKYHSFFRDFLEEAIIRAYPKNR
jgi:hypothetical protein